MAQVAAVQRDLGISQADGISLRMQVSPVFGGAVGLKSVCLSRLLQHRKTQQLQ